MNILSITAQKPHSTGSGTYMTELVRAFARMGHQQAVVCGIYPSDNVDFPAGVVCHPVFFTGKGTAASEELFCGCKRKSSTAAAANALPFPIVGMSDIMPYESTRYRDLTPKMISLFEEAFIGAVSRAVTELDPDLIICHHLFLLTALVRKHFPGRRVIGISHGTDLRQMVNCDNLREIVRPYITCLDMALALHGRQRAQIMDTFGLEDTKVAVIGSGYNSSLFNTEGRSEREPGAPLRLCYAGKISRPKGVPEMMDALSMLAGNKDVPPFELTMAGGCQDESLKDALGDLPPYADWLGQIPQPALADLMRRTDIFILPSYFEGLPLVLIEAMASGAVPVSTDLPGVRDWIDSHVPGSNIRYIKMPEMKSVDEPTDTGRGVFTQDLYLALRTLMTGFEQGRLPDTSAITWSGLADRLLDICG